MSTRPCTLVIVGVEAPLLDRQTSDLPQNALHGYWDFLWELTGQYRIAVVIEQTQMDVSATAVQLVEGGYDRVRVPAPVEPWDPAVEKEILAHLPRGEGDTALLVCRSQHVHRLAERLSAHVRQIKTIAAPDLQLKDSP